MKNLLLLLLITITTATSSFSTNNIVLENPEEESYTYVLEIKNEAKTSAYTFTTEKELNHFIENDLPKFSDVCEVTIGIEVCAQPAGVGACVSVEITGSCSELAELIDEAQNAIDELRDAIL